jgi:NADPH2:quinone reductase
VRAVWIERHGGPEVLELRDVPLPEPGTGELLVDVTAIGVNYRDVYERAIPGYAGPLPRVVGVEGAGTVGEDRVAWIDAPGSYAEQAVVSAERAVPIPDGVSDEQAAAVLLQGITAQYLSASAHPVAEGDRVVVHAAAGGVGHLLTQLVRLRGGHVLATTSSDEKAELARAAGAEEVVGYDEFRERAASLDVDVVYDGVGAATFDASLEALRPRGTMVLYGAASGQPAPFAPGGLAARSLFLTRPALHHYTATRAELLERASAVLELVAAGRLEVRIGARYALEDARRAHEDLEARRTTGKLLLIPMGSRGQLTAWR